MRILPGEDGAALVTALMLTVLSLIVALTLLYAVTAGTKISASQKRYRSALAAAQGGVELVTREIIPRLLQLQPESEANLQDEFSLIALQLPNPDCLQQKLGSATASWSACGGPTSSDPSDHPDFSFTMGGVQAFEPGYSVTMKIVDTVPGNTDNAGLDLLDPGNSVAGRDDGIRPQHIPGIFNISVQGLGGNSREKARLSLLYAY